IEAAIAWAEAVENPRIVFWLHKGAAGFMSDQHFKEFYWPSLKRVVLALVEKGLTPILHVQGDYTPRLPYLAELPRGKVPIHYDRVDHQKALEIMGDRQCFWGGISSAALATGTQEQVSEEVTKLIDLFGSKGGLIVDGSVGIPDEARPENIQAMVDVVREYNDG
ncbi:MAG: uroporphyrinogen decarboxylase family protein, partial [Anaerolineales bacterium]